MSDRQGRQAGTIKTPGAIAAMQEAVAALVAQAQANAAELDSIHQSSGSSLGLAPLVAAIDWADVDWQPIQTAQTGGKAFT